MPKAYSMDLRKRVMDACKAGRSAGEVAEVYAVSRSFMEKLKRREREAGTLAAKPPGGGRKALLAGHDGALRALVAAKPDLTLEGLREELGVSVQLSTLWNRLDRLGLTYKKNAERGGTGTGRRGGGP